MSKLSVNPLVLGLGAFVVAAAGSSAYAADLDAAFSSDALDSSQPMIAGAHGEEGECGEKEGDSEEGSCGEGQCGEDHEGEEEESSEEEEEEA